MASQSSSRRDGSPQVGRGPPATSESAGCPVWFGPVGLVELVGGVPAISFLLPTSAFPPGGQPAGCARVSHSDRGCHPARRGSRSEEHTSELQSQSNLVCRL